MPWIAASAPPAAQVVETATVSHGLTGLAVGEKWAKAAATAAKVGRPVRLSTGAGQVDAWLQVVNSAGVLVTPAISIAP